MADVFISDVEEDRALALAVLDGLEATGFTAWAYSRDAVPGFSLPPVHVGPQGNRHLPDVHGTLLQHSLSKLHT